MTHSGPKSLLFHFFLPSPRLLNHHLDLLTRSPGCKKAPCRSQGWLEHLNMKWPRQGMETAWQGESHADPQAWGPPISSSEHRELSCALSLFLSLLPFSFLLPQLVWIYLAFRRGGRMRGDEGKSEGKAKEKGRIWIREEAIPVSITKEAAIVPDWCHSAAL